MAGPLNGDTQIIIAKMEENAKHQNEQLHAIKEDVTDINIKLDKINIENAGQNVKLATYNEKITTNSKDIDEHKRAWWKVPGLLVSILTAILLLAKLLQ